MSQMKAGMTLIDPFVGSGTIVLEAAIMYAGPMSFTCKL
jgi:23S rRNA G2445 N2-methylase RlmL